MSVYEDLRLAVSDYDAEDVLFLAQNSTQDFILGLEQGIQHVRRNRDLILAAGCEPSERFTAALSDAQIDFSSAAQRPHDHDALRAGMQVGVVDGLERGVTV